MNLHKHHLYVNKQHSDSFKIWSAIIKINIQGKSWIMKFSHAVKCVNLNGKLFLSYGCLGEICSEL